MSIKLRSNAYYVLRLKGYGVPESLEGLTIVGEYVAKTGSYWASRDGEFYRIFSDMVADIVREVDLT